MPDREKVDPSRTSAADAKLAAQVRDWAMRPRNYRGDPPLLTPAPKGDVNLPAEKDDLLNAELRRRALRAAGMKD